MEMLTIRNMVCPRCLESVERIFSEAGFPDAVVTLGKVELSDSLDKGTRAVITQKLADAGFELLDDPRAKLVNEIKQQVISRVRNMDGPQSRNFSRFLSDVLHKDFSSLSRLFSSVEGITLERFILRVKTEFVKELLIYDELTLAEIAYRLDYSSASHLSGQFKKETGMTPTAFRKLSKPSRQPLDSL